MLANGKETKKQSNKDTNSFCPDPGGSSDLHQDLNSLRILKLMSAQWGWKNTSETIWGKELKVKILCKARTHES